MNKDQSTATAANIRHFPMETFADYGSVSTKILAAYTFRDNGYCQSKKMFDSDADGKFSIKGNKITITSPSGLSETFTYRLESELIYDHWNKYLYLTDKNGNESKLLFQGD